MHCWWDVWWVITVALLVGGLVGDYRCTVGVMSGG